MTGRAKRVTIKCAQCDWQVVAIHPTSIAVARRNATLCWFETGGGTVREPRQWLCSDHLRQHRKISSADD